MVIELNKIVGVTTASNKRKRSLTEMCLCVNISRFNNYRHGHITSYHHICIVIGFLKPFPNPDCRFQSWLLFEGRIKIEISNDAHAAYAPEVPTRANPHAAFALHKACMPHHSWNTWESPSQSFVLQHMAIQPNPHVFLFFLFLYTWKFQEAGGSYFLLDSQCNYFCLGVVWQKNHFKARHAWKMLPCSKRNARWKR